MLRARALLVLAVSLLVPAVLALPPSTRSSDDVCSSAPDRSWDGGGDGSSWLDTLNWDPNGLPQPGEHVCIEGLGAPTIFLSQGIQTVARLQSAKPLTIDGATLELTDVAHESLMLDLTLTGSGTLAGPAAVRLQGGITWAGGTMTGAGTAIVDPGGILTIEAPGGVELRGGRTLVMDGEAFWNEGTIHSGEGASIVSTSTFLVPGEGALAWLFDLGGARPRLHVVGPGFFAKGEGTGTATIEAELDNDGLVLSGSGTLAFTGGDGAGSASGRFFGSSPGEVALRDGGFDLDQGADFAGRVAVDGSAVVNVNASIPADRDFSSNGRFRLADDAVLQGSGTLTAHVPSEWTGGHMAGGTTVIAPDGSLTMDAGPGGYLHFHGHTLRVAGTATWESGGIRSGQGALLEVLGTLTIAGDDILSFDYGGAQARLHVAPGGTLRKSGGTGTTTIVAVSDNDGTVDVERGTFALETFTNTGVLRGTGTISIPGAVVSSGEVAPGASPGVLTIDGDYVQAPSGRLRIEIAGEDLGSEYDQLTTLGAVTLDGTLTIETVKGFDPPLGSAFDIVTGGRTGEFAGVEGAVLPSGLVYRPHYEPDKVRLVVEEPGQPPPPPPPPPPVPPPPQPPPRRVCRVPNVVGKPLRRAKLLVRRAGCRIGAVRRARSRRRAGRVVSQRPTAGRRVPLRTRVSLVVSAGRS
ncbi:MAG TPA: PASTA domain-containing protein [Gaiellaceae bacterium]|nr:PASTA domain-containing protein [Gaiellaceae bacterium]